MSRYEDGKIIMRGIRRKTVETFLLVLGLALGVGAAAAGIALAMGTMAVSEEALSTPQYREIIVSTRESSTEMDAPLLLRDTAGNVVLTSADLAASGEAPDTEYAYVKSDERFQNMALMTQRFQNARSSGNAAGFIGGPGQVIITGPAGNAAAVPDQGTTGNVSRNIQSQEGEPAQRTTPRTDGSQGGTQSGPVTGTAGGQPLIPPAGDPERFEMPEIDLSGPIPVPEEWYGYLVSPEYFEAWGLHAASGSIFTIDDIRNSTNPMVLGSTLAQTLYDDGIALGRKPIAGRTIYTITGILNPTGTVLDNMAFAPAFMPDVQRNIRGGGFGGMRGGWNTTLRFMVKDASRLEEAASQLEAYFEQEYGEGSVVITIPREQAQAARDRNQRIVTLILFLALTGLFIAGVNVSNTLLSRALKRQKTVGILKALGASKNRIFRLFFMEAFIIGVLGTLLGTGFSILLSGLIRETTNLGGAGILELALGIGISWIAATILIVFPSMQAAGVPAAEAMRNE